MLLVKYSKTGGQVKFIVTLDGTDWWRYSYTGDGEYLNDGKLKKPKKKKRL